jgi:hypothetical protein
VWRVCSAVFPLFFLSEIVVGRSIAYGHMLPSTVSSPITSEEPSLFRDVSLYVTVVDVLLLHSSEALI